MCLWRIYSGEVFILSIRFPHSGYQWHCLRDAILPYDFLRILPLTFSWCRFFPVDGSIFLYTIFLRLSSVLRVRFISFISLQCRRHLRMFSLSRLSCSSCPRPRFGGAECTILWVPSIMGLLRHVHIWGVPLGHISLRSTPRSYESKSEPFLTQSEYDWESTILRINFYTSLSSTYSHDRAFWSELYNRALQSIAFW